jgi:hypothetical protein
MHFQKETRERDRHTLPLLLLLFGITTKVDNSRRAATSASHIHTNHTRRVKEKKSYLTDNNSQENRKGEREKTITPSI